MEQPEDAVETDAELGEEAEGDTVEVELDEELGSEVQQSAASQPVGVDPELYG